MFIDKCCIKGKTYLRLTQSIRKPNKQGKMVASKEIVLNLGKQEEYDDGKPDYLKRLRESFRAGHPLIPMLNDYVGVKSIKPEVYNFSIEKGSEDCFGKTRLFSQLLLERILEELGIKDLAHSIKHGLKIQYDFYGFIKLLTFGRLLHPASKCATIRQNDYYYEPIIKDEDFNEDNVYDTLSLLAANKSQFIRRINHNLVAKNKRSPSLIYYDVTNFYFETEEPDEDMLDEDGNLMEAGLRKYGVSKEHRHQPIVQMGLFMDDDGLPISVESFPGNTLDHLTLEKALKDDLEDLGFSRFVMVADRGICCYPNLVHLTDIGHGYIVSKSLLKSNKAERDWAYDEEGFIEVSPGFKYKSRMMEREVRMKDGTRRTIKEQVIVYFSSRFQKKAEHENHRFLEFLKKLEQSPHSFRVTAGESKTLRKFFRRQYLNTKTGEVVDSAKLRAMVDFKKVEEYRRSLGFYQIVTSELDMDPQEVINKYHGLTQIEDQFREMKGSLETRPIYVRTKEHIEAHLLVCTIALIMLRIIQQRIIKSGKVELAPDAYWNTGLSGERIQEALNRWKVGLMPNGLYQFFDVDDPDLKLILNAFNIELPAQMYNKTELRQIKTKIEVFK